MKRLLNYIADHFGLFDGLDIHENREIRDMLRISFFGGGCYYHPASGKFYDCLYWNDEMGENPVLKLAERYIRLEDFEDDWYLYPLEDDELYDYFDFNTTCRLEDQYQMFKYGMIKAGKRESYGVCNEEIDRPNLRTIFNFIEDDPKIYGDLEIASVPDISGFIYFAFLGKAFTYDVPTDTVYEEYICEEPHPEIESVCGEPEFKSEDPDIDFSIWYYPVDEVSEFLEFLKKAKKDEYWSLLKKKK